MSEKIRGFDYLTIAGKKRPFQVHGTRQTKAFCEIRECDHDEYWTEVAKMTTNGVLSNLDITQAFIYSALFAGAKREKLPIDFDLDDVINWFEDADDSEGVELLKPLQLFAEMVNKTAEGLKKVKGQ
ncbi:hypothetical protein F1C16_05205 [Hymenobacter sp. NBH84]|uniref:hypothetical protein n=1 Tax=Hymenobacter sp. NBH84 TaxID=2596915 RepID=UPI0016294A13|nr:hypothetical protein [Hymenobacter sp. NBH84]QNE38993.1 hypothetical protein F1C16_05205 [Hymenobacter sp. NBH84]